MLHLKQDSLTRKIKLGLVHAEGEGGGQGNKEGGEGDGSGGSSDGSQGGNGEQWYKGLPETVQSWDEVKNSDTQEKFWDQMANQRSRMGRSITVPGEDAGAEQMQEFYNKLTDKVPGLIPTPNPENKEAMDALYNSLGRPETHAEYAVPEIEGMKDTSAAEFMKAPAHELGLSKSQYEGIVKSFGAKQVEMMAAMEEARMEGHTGLQTEWGQDYDRRMGVAANIAKLTDAPEKVVEMLKEGQADAETYKLLYGIASKFQGEGSNLIDDLQQNAPRFTPQEAQDQITEIQGNKQHPFWDRSNPAHKEAVEKMKKLYELKEKAGS